MLHGCILLSCAYNGPSHMLQGYKPQELQGALRVVIRVATEGEAEEAREEEEDVEVDSPVSMPTTVAEEEDVVVDSPGHECAATYP